MHNRKWRDEKKTPLNEHQQNIKRKRERKKKARKEVMSGRNISEGSPAGNLCFFVFFGFTLRPLFNAEEEQQ